MWSKSLRVQSKGDQRKKLAAALRGLERAVKHVCVSASQVRPAHKLPWVGGGRERGTGWGKTFLQVGQPGEWGGAQIQ